MTIFWAYKNCQTRPKKLCWAVMPLLKWVDEGTLYKTQHVLIMKNIVFTCFYMFLHVFTIKGSGFSCKMSHHPILWFVLSIFVGWRFAGDQDLPTCLKHVETRNSWCRDHILSHCLTTWFWPVTTGPSFRTEKGGLDEERCTAWELEQAQGSVAQQRG